MMMKPGGAFNFVTLGQITENSNRPQLRPLCRHHNPPSCYIAKPVTAIYNISTILQTNSTLIYYAEELQTVNSCKLIN